MAIPALVLAAVLAAPVSAQEGGPGVPADGAIAPSTTAPAATAPAAPGSPPPDQAVDPTGGAGASPPTTDAPVPEVVELDVTSIDALLAEARARAQQLRNAQIATAVSTVRTAESDAAAGMGRLAEAGARLDEAEAVVTTRRTEAEVIRRRIGTIAADAFMRVGTDRDEAMARLRSGEGATDDSAAVDAQQTRIYADGAIDATRTDLAEARALVADAEDVRDAASDAADQRRAELEGLEAVAGAARSAEAALRAAPLDVPAAATVSSLYGSVGPTILGRSLLNAEDLAAFVRSRGRPHPTVDVEALARAFIDEGEAEGVRADLAWAQSIIETGYFGFAGSMVAPTDHNYAGIGACDSCSRGFDYATPELGVRAQIQLLRTYADRTITAARLARPPAGRAPERVGVRGCCATWMALSGVWATGPQYGAKILTVYNDMLRLAVDRRLSASPATTEAVIAAEAPVPSTPPPVAGAPVASTGPSPPTPPPTTTP